MHTPCVYVQHSGNQNTSCFVRLEKRKCKKKVAQKKENTPRVGPKRTPGEFSTARDQCAAPSPREITPIVSHKTLFFSHSYFSPRRPRPNSPHNQRTQPLISCRTQQSPHKPRPTIKNRSLNPPNTTTPTLPRPHTTQHRPQPAQTQLHPPPGRVSTHHILNTPSPPAPNHLPSSHRPTQNPHTANPKRSPNPDHQTTR